MRKFGSDPKIFCFVSPQLAPEVGLEHAIAAPSVDEGEQKSPKPQTSAMSAADKAAAEAKAAKRLGFDNNTKKKTNQSRAKRTKRSK